MKIIKADGERVEFEPEKIVRSLERAGAGTRTIQEVLTETEKEMFDGIRTKQLYKIVYKNLKKLSRGTAGKYHLKNAIMELGPTGFPFEKFIAAILEADGYQTLTNQIVEGFCVNHELDVIAAKDNNYFMLECKFHSTPGNVCDVKVALYVYARFLDVEKIWLKKPGHAQKFHQGWLITNTRLTSDAEKYGKCVGMGLLSWNYPKGDSIRERIDKHRLYPITCLTSLSKREKETLLHKGIVLCRTLCERPSELNGIGLPESKKLKVLEESKNICRNYHEDL